MFLLPFNIFYHLWNLWFAVWKSAIPLLPWEPVADEFSLVYPFGRIAFDMFEQIGNWLNRPHAKKNMNMVRHTVNSKNFMSMITNNTCGVFIQFTFPLFANDTLSVLNWKDGLNMYLCIGVCHKRISSLRDESMFDTIFATDILFLTEQKYKIIYASTLN